MPALLLLAIFSAGDVVRLRIESVPVGATVLLGTREVGVTPLTVEVPRGQQVAVSAWSRGQFDLIWVTPTKASTIKLHVPPLPSASLRFTLAAVLDASTDPSCQALARAIREDGAGWAYDRDDRKWTAAAEASDTMLAIFWFDRRWRFVCYESLVDEQLSPLGN